MKYTSFILFLIIPVLAVNAMAIKEETKLQDENAKVSYSFGMVVGIDLQQAGLEIDYEAFTEGLKAALESGETRIDYEEAYEIVQNAFESAMTKQANLLRAKEEEFLGENSLRPDIHLTESGLQYLILEEGSGPKPAADDIVVVHYEASLTDGTVFDSSYLQDQPDEIPLDMVIPGWAEGIQLMNVGSKYQLYIPSYMAYGERGAGQIIPPYSTLIFTVELIGIVEKDDDDDDDGEESAD